MTLGIEWTKPVTTVKNAIEEIKTLTSGIYPSGAALQGAKAVQEAIPMYMGAQGPKMLETSGEIADGCLINASNPKDFEAAIQWSKGIDAAGKNIADFWCSSLYFYFYWTDSEAAKKQQKIVVAFIAAGAPPMVIERHGLPEGFNDKCGDCLAKGDFGGAIGLIDDAALDAFSVCGTPDEFVPKIEALGEMGVTQYVAGSPLGKTKKNLLNY